MNTSSAISVIRNLSDKDLIEALYEIVQDRNIFEEEAEWSQNKIIICNANRDKDEQDQYGNWKVDLLALHDPKKYDSEWSEDCLLYTSPSPRDRG